MNTHPTFLYTPEDVKRLDQLAIESGIPGYTLMRRAGQSVFDVLVDYFPDAKKLLVVCGAGNNAGDGYVVARLAQQQGFMVNVVSLVNPEQLKGDAEQAYTQWTECAELADDDTALLAQADVVIDALLGTGLDRDVDGRFKRWIEAINAAEKSVIAIDVPSGLDAFTGAVRGTAIRADVTVSFIGLKTGLYTASGRACCGEMEFDSLDVPRQVYESVKPFAVLLDSPECWHLPGRSHDSHKGDYGHVLIVGGNHGMPGAVILAGRAAMRGGAGSVSVVTRVEHITAVAAACPELMVHGSVNGELPASLASNISVIAIGPGLGQDAWAHRLLMNVRELAKPLVLDADALNLVAAHQIGFDVPVLMTPHPGEAARLLSKTTAEVQANRFLAARELYEMSTATVVLKGSGSIVFDGATMQLCPLGNPAMAVAGMGDVLTGVMASLIAQGMSLSQAASKAVCLHARAGDQLAESGVSSLLASEVIEQLPFAAVL